MAPTNALAPALHRSPTRLTIRDEGTSRVPSPAPQRPERSDADSGYKTGIYADPKPVKHWGLGQALYTPEHVKLLARFRDECGRLYGHSKNLSERAQSLDRKLRNLNSAVERLEDANADLRERIVDKNEQLRGLSNDLKEAHQSLAEMDAMFAGNRSKRLSRLQAKNFDIPDDIKDELAHIP